MVVFGFVCFFSFWVFSWLVILRFCGLGVFVLEFVFLLVVFCVLAVFVFGCVVFVVFFFCALVLGLFWVVVLGMVFLLGCCFFVGVCLCGGAAVCLVLFYFCGWVFVCFLVGIGCFLL